MAYTARDPPRSYENFEIAFLCNLAIEADAVISLLDHRWDDATISPFDHYRDDDTHGPRPTSSEDGKKYTFGRIGRHDVVVVILPMGKKEASSAVTAIDRTFCNLQLAIVVGVCAVAPYHVDGSEIVLGDVVISGSVVLQYSRAQEVFLSSDTLGNGLGNPQREVQELLKLHNLEPYHEHLEERMRDYTKQLQSAQEVYAYPGTSFDQLYAPHYTHMHRQVDTCSISREVEEAPTTVCKTARLTSCADAGCDRRQLIARRRLLNKDGCHTSIWFGRFTSSDQDLKSATYRDGLQAQKNVIAFDIECGNAWDHFPTIIVKSGCDYGDHHKNDIWQKHCAGNAAACAKALLYEWQNRPADELCRQALEAHERVLGENHPDTLVSINNLASVLSRQGQHVQAEQLYRRALQQSEQIHADQHPNKLAIINNLASVLSSQGQYVQAEQLCLLALEATKRVYGRSHPDTLASANSLALVLGSQGKYKEAEELQRWTLEANEMLLGERHPNTLAVMKNLATILDQQGQHIQAEKLHRRHADAYGQRLQLVSAKEYAEMVRSPLEHGANVHAPRVSTEGHEEISQVLHRQDADISAPRDDYHLSVEAASLSLAEGMNRAPYMNPDEYHDGSTDSDTASNRPSWCQSLETLLAGTSIDNTSEGIAQFCEDDDGPWVFVSPEDFTNIPCEIQRESHIENCVHQMSEYGPLQTKAGSKTSDVAHPTKALTAIFDGGRSALVRRKIQTLSGLGGICPFSKDRNLWNGSVEVSSKTQSADISFQRGRDARLECLDRILASLNRLLQGLRILQEEQICCDRYTILCLEAPSFSTVDHVTIPFHLVCEFRDCAQALSSSNSDKDPAILERIIDATCRIFPNRAILMNTTSSVHILGVMTQVLALGLVSYLQAHTGSVEPFFLAESLETFRLHGIAGIENAKRVRRLYATAQLINLACVGNMLQDRVLAFRLCRWSEEPTDSINIRHGLRSNCIDFYETWGPGQIWCNDFGIFAIEIGGGLLYQPTPADPHLHWSQEYIADVKELPTFGLSTRFTIGTLISVNTGCQLQASCLLRAHSNFLVDLGTKAAAWERQHIALSFAGKPFEATMQWSKVSGRLLKEYLLAESQKRDESLFYVLDQRAAVEISLCTKLGRRRRLREAMADLLQIYAKTIALALPEWERLDTTYDISMKLRGIDDLREWFTSLHSQEASSALLLRRLIREILAILASTGYQTMGKCLLAAWPNDRHHSQGLKIPLHESNGLIRMLADSADSVTFVYLTTNCLTSGQHLCRADQSISCFTGFQAFETQVFVSGRNGDRRAFGASLQHQEIYFMGSWYKPLAFKALRVGTHTSLSMITRQMWRDYWQVLLKLSRSSNSLWILEDCRSGGAQEVLASTSR